MTGDGLLQFSLPIAVATDDAGGVCDLEAGRHRVYSFGLSRWR
jgi:hypothetical protein